MVALIVGLLALPLIQFVRGMGKLTTDSSQKLVAQQKIHRAFIFMDRDFSNMTLISSASIQFIEFRLDSNRLPGYDPNALVDGIPRIQHPDVDGDRYTLPTPAIPDWSVGDNLMDDDDDNNNLIDVQCRYFLEGTNLIRDFNFNQAGWGQNRFVIAKGVVSLSFNYFAFTSTAGNETLSTNAEGLVEGITVDASRDNNRVAWDTENERNRIDLVRVSMGCNERNPQNVLRSDFAPHFLVVRRGRV